MPRLPVKRFRADTDNVQILNAIRKNASSEYQRRIPEATKANIQDTVNKLVTNGMMRNEFIDALVNQIGLVVVRSLNWDNPLAKFKRGMLQYGDTIEEIQAGLVSAYVYDPDRDEMERALFGQERPNVQASLHKINRQNYYKITINQDMLRRAFTSDTGLIDLVNEFMNVPTVSDNHDEFLAMSSLFRVYDDAEGFFRVNVPDISDLDTSDRENASVFLKKVRSMADTLQFLSPHYNASGMHVAAKADDLELFITPEANAAIDVDALAAAFNTDRASVPSRITVIPREHFRVPNVQGILTTRDFFVVADSLYETRSQPNPVGLYDNYFLHHHQVLSVSRFVPAVAFTTDPGTVITIEDNPVASVAPIEVRERDLESVVTSVKRGEYYQILGSAVTTPEGGVNDAIRLSISGENVSPFTYITQTGALHVSLMETADEITVTATAVADQSKTATVTLEVTGDRAQLWTNPQVVADGDSPTVPEDDPEGS